MICTSFSPLASSAPPPPRATPQVREFQMLRSLRHPNIIRLYAAYETPKKLYLVTEARGSFLRPPPLLPSIPAPALGGAPRRFVT